MDKESKVHTMFKASRHRAPHVCVTHRKPLGIGLRRQVSDVQKNPQTDMIISIRLVQKGKRMTTMSGITTRAKHRISVRVVAMYIDSRA